MFSPMDSNESSPIPRLGYALSSEEHAPLDLIRHARLAEETGFAYALISDHFHPWTGRQGQASFVWSVLGALATATDRLVIGTGVTCPSVRTHPVIVAQAAATVATMMPGRFFLGVGTGENLNEHILGDKWPASDVRREMLEEAIGIIRALWEGEELSHRGTHYTVENATVYTRPAVPPPLLVAAAGSLAARLAGRQGDGLIATTPDPSLVEAFLDERGAGDSGQGPGGAPPRIGQLTVCWAPDEDSARRTAHEWWPNAALHGELTAELPLPAHFEQATVEVTEEQIARSIVCGPDADAHIRAIAQFVDAGFDHVYVHQVGPDQQGFMRFYGERVLPAFT
jgi:coenzyme F420-dependent glucose-6-phosphate dehydrogenase